MKLLHYFHKLRKMPPREIQCRVAEKLRVRRERRSYNREGAPAADIPAADLARNCRALVPGTTAEERQRLESAWGTCHQQLATAAGQRAEEVLSGNWPLLGYGVDLRGEIDWHADPRTDYIFPREFYADLSLYEIGNGVDVKYVWELGRHQYLPELARGWLFHGEEKYAAAARRLLLSWIADNRVNEGVHWTSALEFAMRGISWIWTIAALADWDGWQADDFATITRSLREHAEQTEHHLSYYTSPYNHLVGEAAGLYLIGAALAGTDRADHWRRLGHRILTEHGTRQFYSDGFTVEQATGYHFYTLGFMSLVIAAARRAGEPLSELEPVVHRAYRAGLAFRQPGGRWPAIGDVDSARAIPVNHEDFWTFDSLCGLGAALFDDTELAPPQMTFSEEAYWLLGGDSLDVLKNAEGEAQPTATLLPQSGYAIAQAGEDWVCFDAGPLGDGLHADATPSTAHGHADALQVLYRHNGRDLLIDPGMPFYFGGDDWVGHFRAPEGHNTLTVEGAAMARRAGRLAWSHVAPRPQLDVRFADDVWLARGRATWAAGTIVERYLLAIPGRGLWIADRITTDQPRTIGWYWQLPDETAAPATWSTTEVQTTIETARDDSPIAWNAPGYGVRLRGCRVHNTAAATDSLLLVTFFGDAALPLEIRIGDQTLSCPTNDDAPATWHRPWPAEGDAVWRFEQDGQLLTYVAGSAQGGSNRVAGAGDWAVTKQVELLDSATSLSRH